MNVSDILINPKPATLFPVLADTNKEQRITSILLALFPQIPALAGALLENAGQSIGKRAIIECYTEVVLQNGDASENRPDGLIVLTVGKRIWTALVEAKIGKAQLDEDQVRRYVELARANNIDAVITISNEFVTRADHSPVKVNKALLRKTDLFHWSWTSVRTICNNLAYQQTVKDQEQAFLLSEFNRFLDNDKTGVERFTHMGKTWKELVQAVLNREKLNKTAPEVEMGVASWFAEERDLCLQMSRHIGEPVNLKIERKLQSDPIARLKAGVANLITENMFRSTFQITDSAGDMEVCADLMRKTISVSIEIKAALDRKTTKARVNWLLRMVKSDDPRLLIRAHWPGRGNHTQSDIETLRETPGNLQNDNPASAPHTFVVLLVEDIGKRFSGSRTIIEDLERIVPEFYDLVGQNLRSWQPAPPKPVKAVIPEQGDEADEIDLI